MRGAATFSTGARPQPPRQKTVEEAKAERESEYPIMLVNPRTSMGDAAPVFMIAALYFLYCFGADVFDAIFPAPLPMPSRAEDDAADEMKVPPLTLVISRQSHVSAQPTYPHAAVAGASRWARAHEGRQYSPAMPRRGRSLIHLASGGIYRWCGGAARGCCLSLVRSAISGTHHNHSPGRSLAHWHARRAHSGAAGPRAHPCRAPRCLG